MADKGYEFVIDNGVIYKKEYVATKSLSLKELAKKIVQREETFSTPTLPMNTLVFKSTAKFNIYYVLVPEDNYLVTSENQNRTATAQYAVRFPNIIFAFKFNKAGSSISDVRTFWTKNENVTADTLSKKVFYIPPLQNIYENCGVCMGSYKTATTQHETVNNYMKSFFENVFNFDLSGGKLDISAVSREQQKLFKEGKSEHSLIEAWWGAGVSSTFKTLRNISDYFGEGQ